MVITDMTRNFLKSWLFAPLKKPVKSGVFSGSKIKYFVVLSVSSFQKFLEEMRNHIHGELSERSKVQHSKSYTVVLCDYLKSGLNTDFLSSCFEQLRFFLTAFLTDLHLIFKFTLAFAM